MPQVTYLEAIRQGIWEEMERDPTVFCLGEDIGIYGGAFKVTDGFIDRFGPERVIDTPIAESAIVGAAFGAATAASGHCYRRKTGSSRERADWRGAVRILSCHFFRRLWRSAKRRP